MVSSCPEKDILQQWFCKGPIVGRCSKATAAAAWATSTAGGPGAWLAAEDTLPVGWLEERRRVDVGQLLLMVYPFAGSSWLYIPPNATDS